MSRSRPDSPATWIRTVRVEQTEKRQAPGVHDAASGDRRRRELAHLGAGCEKVAVRTNRDVGHQPALLGNLGERAPSQIRDRRAHLVPVDQIVRSGDVAARAWHPRLRA